MSIKELPLINREDQEHAQKKLQGYYKSHQIPPEKKPYLTHLKESVGPYLGIETPHGKSHYLLDAASQIATLGLGFNSPVLMGAAHYQESWSNDQKSPTTKEIVKAFKAFLKRKLGGHLKTMLFAHSGAEANELALRLAYERRVHPGARKVLAFEGSFHGRMLISLLSTWNPSKREPFQVPGLETLFSPYPELEGDKIQQPFPPLWREFWESSPGKTFIPPPQWSSDPTLQREIHCLLKVREELLSKNIFALLIEPMQCEGGDRYSSDRFHTALILMAKSFGVPVIYDEVQTGFHLGREFFWHQQFALKTKEGTPLNPDYIVCAKKAQLGLVLSSHNLNICPLKQKSMPFSVVSLIRGYFQALALDQAQLAIKKQERVVAGKLQRYCEKYSNFICRPRACGLSFAFDLLDPKMLQKFVQKRFDYGLLYYPAGEKTLRFRLNTAFDSQDLHFLFECLESLAQCLFLEKKSTPPTHAPPLSPKKEHIYHWQKLLLEARIKRARGQMEPPEKVLLQASKAMNLSAQQKLVRLGKDNFSQYARGIEELQQLVYEPARQTSLKNFEKAAWNPQGICLILENHGQIEAMSFASPLQDHPSERGLRQDPFFENPQCLYMLDTTIAPQEKGRGWGRQMKYALTLLAMAEGVERLQGRNRDKLAAPMLSINLSLGSHEQLYLSEDYPDSKPYRDVLYYTTNLVWKKPPLFLSNRINSPLEFSDMKAQDLVERLPQVANKVCLSNFTSENYLAQVQSLLQLAPPPLRHSYTSSSQSECVDKIFKSLWYSKRHQRRLLTFQGHYFGEGSFLSWALSGGESQLFEVDRLPHPQQHNGEEILHRLKELVQQQSYSSLWIEPLRQKDLSSVPSDFLKELKELCDRTQTPLIYNETASQMFSYDSQNYFVCQDGELTPNASFAFLGGQAGLVMIAEEFFVKKPLMMISTWDGDELSMAGYHQAMTTILKDPQEFLKTCQQFEVALKEKLRDYPLSQWSLKNARGSFQGDLPLSHQQLFRKEGEKFIVDPNYASMKRFIHDSN